MTPTVYWVHTDHLGTPRMMTDAGGAVVWETVQAPFGAVRTTNELAELNVRFPGQYLDAETGAHYNYHRYYSPNAGRYLKSDPIGVMGGLNQFSYASNNPVRFTDRKGLLVDVVPDAVLILYDIYRLVRDNVFSSCDNLGTNLAALGADVAAVFIPGVTGAGVGVRASSGAIGFAKGTAESALTGMRNDGGHAIRHLQGDIIPNTGSLQSRVEAFKQIATPILENPSHSANWRIGATEGRAFLGEVGDRVVAIVVAKDGPHQGKVVSAFVPDPTQLQLMLSR